MEKEKDCMQDQVEAMVRLGISRVEAVIVMALLEGALQTAQLIAKTGLRQPQVSKGMKGLRGRGWVASRTVPRGGKGRPMLEIYLLVTPEQLVEHFEPECRRITREVAEAMQALRRLA